MSFDVIKRTPPIGCQFQNTDFVWESGFGVKTKNPVSGLLHRNKIGSNGIHINGKGIEVIQY